LTYTEAEKYLYSLEGRGWKLDLERIEKLLEKLDSPHHHFESIHIAGTNGKGSVAAMLESILHHAGYRTGLFTSPHLVEARERIVVSGKQIPQKDLTLLMTRIRPLVDSLGCTFFETVTALAFLYFCEQHVEIAIVEVGLGGRFDATNVLTPILSVITDIDLDHTQHLGNDLLQIASEKAGIIKTGVPCLSKSNNPVVREVVNRIGRSRGAEIVEVAEESEVLSVTMSHSGSTFDVRIQESVLRNITLPLVGKHQVKNAQTALVAVTMLKHLGRDIGNEDLVRGLAATEWPGRCQKISDNPIVIIDAAHNPASIRVLRKVLEELYPKRRKTIIMGVMADKDYSSMVAEIAPIAQSFIAVQPAQIRALSCETLAYTARKYSNDVIEFNKVSLGFDYALQSASSDSLICVTGSHYTIGEIIADRKKYIDKMVKN
jgi:dihydrofolate synthase/folylpolyglutamate synthase